MPALYNFQKQALAELNSGKKVCVLQMGCGKSAVALRWATDQQAITGKKHLLIVTTASKRTSGDFEREADIFAPTLKGSLSSLSVISWHTLAKWVNQHWSSIEDYIYIFDEAKCTAGVSSGMGRAFLKITKRTQDWTLYTGTPGQNWLHFYPYFQATGLSRGKTSFLHDYATVQTFKGYPEIVAWRQEDKLKSMWQSISTTPDTSQMLSELPREAHKVVEFKMAPDYLKILKTRQTASGEPLDTVMSLMVALRKACFTNAKKQWVKDYIENLGTGAVVFYNFISTGDELEQIITKALPKNARIWRIDGRHHEIPTVDTIGKYDIVLCQWQSGSEAINLQFLNYWLSVEPNYSYAISSQARGRIKRIGQTKPMFFHYLKTTKTVEDAIYKSLKQKSDFAEEVWLAENNINFKEEKWIKQS